MDLSAETQVVTTRQLSNRGWTRGQLRTTVRSGDLRRIRRGAYRSGAMDLTAADVYRDSVVATATLNPTRVLSHLSAAVMLGLPLVDADLSVVHLTLPRPTGGRRTAGVHRHPAHGVDRPVPILGLLVSSVARTLADVARTASLHTSVPMMDEALHHRLTTPAQLREQTRAAVRLGGVARLRRSLELLDSAAESPGESLFRLVMGELGLPTPVSQVNLYDAAGRWLARSDFLLEEYGVVIEFDGLVKYGVTEGAFEARNAVIDEKRREDEIRATGLLVVRFIWADLYQRDRLAARVRRAMTQGRRAIDAGLITARARHERFPTGLLTFGPSPAAKPGRPDRLLVPAPRCSRSAPMLTFDHEQRART